MGQIGRSDKSKGLTQAFGRPSRYSGKVPVDDQAACHRRHTYIVDRLIRRHRLVQPNSALWTDANLPPI